MLAPEASLHSALPLLLALLTCSPGPSSPLAPTPAGRAWKPKGEAKSLGEEALPILFTGKMHAQQTTQLPPSMPCSHSAPKRILVCN